jgi:DNA polymerase delta subunit 4
MRDRRFAQKYGPCTGLSRLQRWERAAKLGLDPPMEIGRLLSQLPADDKKAANLWAGRV